MWERLCRSLLTPFRWRLEFRNSFFYVSSTFFRICSDCSSNEMYIWHARLEWLLNYYKCFIMCIGVRLTCLHYPIPRNVRQSLRTLDWESCIQCGEYSIGHTSISRLLWYNTRPNSKTKTRKSMYDTRHEWMTLSFISRSIRGPTTWSVSCCRRAVLVLLTVIHLHYYCRMYPCTAWLRMYFHIKPFFRPVHRQHTRCRCRFFFQERCKLFSHKTTIQRCYIITQ